jgi:hypothetical protein
MATTVTNPSVRQQSNQRSWAKRHPVLLGTMAGAGLAAIGGTGCSRDFEVSCGFYASLGLGVGAGVGALVGLALR